MKKIRLLLLLSFIGLLAACGSAESNSSGEEEFTFLLNNTASSTHHLAVNGFDAWADLVAEETDGRITIEVHHGGSLGGNATVTEDIKGGLYDIGFVATDFSYDTEVFPWSISDLPFAFTDPAQTERIISQVVEEFAVDELNEHVKYLGLSARDPYILISTQPINSIEDVKGLNVIVPGRITTGIVESWGATPVSVDYTESYEALQRGTSDAIAYTGASAGKSGMQYHEVAPYFIENLTITNGLQALIMNKESYEGLPEDLKETFDELAPQLGKMMTESYVNELKTYKDAFDEDEVTFTTLSEEEIQLFSQNGKETWEEWVELAEEKGYPGQEMVDYLIVLLEEEGVNLDFLNE